MSHIILIADDDESDVFFLREALKDACPGCTVFDVGDGQEATDYLTGKGKYADRQAHPVPTHIFLDIKMPRRTGLEVLRWLRTQRELGQIPVAMLSGSQLEADVRQARALGAEYLVKPVDYRTLREMIAAYFRAYRKKEPERP